MEVGQVKGFEEHLPSLLKWAEFLIASDELKKAKTLLTEFLPGYYRDNSPPECVKLLNELSQFWMTPVDYVNNVHDSRQVDPARGLPGVQGLLRGILLLEEVKTLNSLGQVPHILDMGPGEYWLPMGLQQSGVNFTYEGVALMQDAKNLAQAHIGEVLRPTRVVRDSNPVIFNACEIIEHLPDEDEIKITADKFGIVPDYIHISTPKYTYGGGNYIWRTQPAQGGHLRTYTPAEFMAVVTKMFKGYSWKLYDSEIMHVRGELVNKREFVTRGAV